jgi:hypothetical protein
VPNSTHGTRIVEEGPGFAGVELSYNSSKNVGEVQHEDQQSDLEEVEDDTSANRQQAPFSRWHDGGMEILHRGGR